MAMAAAKTAHKAAAVEKGEQRVLLCGFAMTIVAFSSLVGGEVSKVVLLYGRILLGAVARKIQIHKIRFQSSPIQHWTWYYARQIPS